MWTVVNTVYFNDGTYEIYGYKVKNDETKKRKVISSNTAKALEHEGELKFSPYQELSFCSVGRNYEEVL